LKTIKRNVYNTIAKAFGFVVIGNGYGKRHYAISFKEALSWAAGYDDGATVYRRGLPVASKKLIRAAK
jgi:hypothetical protein